MFSEDRKIPGEPSRQNNALLNSVSDFSAKNELAMSRAQLFQQAKETLQAQQQLQKTSSQ